MTEKSDDSAMSSACSVCGKDFDNIQKCLKHELIKHFLQKKSGPISLIQKRINATEMFLNTAEKKLERERLVQELSSCANGKELKTVFRLFCIKEDNLNLIFTRIQTCLHNELNSSGLMKIYPYGSIVSGLALRDCDIDIYIDVSNMNQNPKQKQNKNSSSNPTKSLFNYINKLLLRSSHFSEVFAIRKTRVPIIKCTHNDTGFKIDINVSCPSSRVNTQFLSDLVKSDTRIHELMVFLKLWAKNNQIVTRETMPCYSLITMVIFFLQQPRQAGDAKGKNKKDGRILKSMKELQENCRFHMVEGVNYAYDLVSGDNKPQIPATVTTWHLIKGFFEFYENFDFENNVISPFYGKAIAKASVAPEICDEYYKQLNTITQYLEGEPANNLQINTCICVQDIFRLNHNTAKNVKPCHKEYILFCLQNAKQICVNPRNLTAAQLCVELLYATTAIKATEEKLIPFQIPQSTNNLSYIVTPSKADLRLAVAHYPQLATRSEILNFWCRLCIDAIYIVLTKHYRMDVQKQAPSQHKQQKLDEEQLRGNLSSLWEISCTIDLWTNRCFQKNAVISFMPYQIEQTERLHSLRKHDPNFSVTLNGILKLNVLPNNTGIEIQLELPKDADSAILNKKSPMRKFFNVFKNTLQSFSFKEILNITNSNEDTNETTNSADTVVATDNA